MAFTYRYKDFNQNGLILLWWDGGEWSVTLDLLILPPRWLFPTKNSSISLCTGVNVDYLRDGRRFWSLTFGLWRLFQIHIDLPIPEDQ